MAIGIQTRGFSAEPIAETTHCSESNAVLGRTFEQKTT